MYSLSSGFVGAGGFLTEILLSMRESFIKLAVLGLPVMFGILLLRFVLRNLMYLLDIRIAKNIQHAKIRYYERGNTHFGVGGVTYSHLEGGH